MLMVVVPSLLHPPPLPHPPPHNHGSKKGLQLDDRRDILVFSSTLIQQRLLPLTITCDWIVVIICLMTGVVYLHEWSSQGRWWRLCGRRSWTDFIFLRKEESRGTTTHSIAVKVENILAILCNFYWPLSSFFACQNTTQQERTFMKLQ